MGDPARAIDVSRRAADKALDDLAFEAAVRHLDRAVATLELLTTPDPVLRFDLELVLGIALRAANDRAPERSASLPPRPLAPWAMPPAWPSRRCRWPMAWRTAGSTRTWSRCSTRPWRGWVTATRRCGRG